MNKNTNIDFLLNTILFTKYVLYQDKFTDMELQKNYDVIFCHERFILKNKDWIDDIASIKNKIAHNNTNISSRCIISNEVGYFAYSDKTEEQLYDYLVNDLCDRFISECKMSNIDIKEALETVEADLFEVYRKNLSLANKIILDIACKYKVKPRLKKPLLTVV
ncbi:hypothetical protein LA99_19155 [Salmonella enterica]|nr:hypothetical protein [Salmonella enterica]